MNLKYGLTTLVIVMSFHIQAQVKEVLVGDTCPDITLRGIINYQKNTVKISDFRGKLLILDFWATWCNPCIRSFPKMDSLQKQFSGKLVVLPVTTEDEKTVRLFLEKMNHAIHILPASVTGDKILEAFFKHTYLPHYVWIDDQGIVKAITGGEEVTEANINAMLSRQIAAIPAKKDIVKNMDDQKPAFAVANPLIGDTGNYLDPVPGSDVLYHSLITRFITGIPGYESISDSGRITAVNEPVANLYSVAAGHFAWEFLMPNRVCVEIKDSVLYYRCTGRFMSTKQYVENEDYVKWSKDNAVCYELKVPAGLVKKRFDMMLRDLNMYFGSLYGIEGGMEKRKAMVLILKRITDEDKLKTKGISKPFHKNAYSYSLYNGAFHYFIEDMRLFYQLSWPLIDETGYDGKVDIELNCRLSDITEVNKELEKYGLKFTEEPRDIDMVVIKQKPG